MKKIFLSSVLAVCCLSVANADEKVLNPNNPDPYKGFRMDYAEMVEIANPDRLSFRIFYKEPSKGRHKEWFDAVKRGDIEKVKEMVKNGQDIEAVDQEALGQTALGWAAFIGYEDIVDFLLENNASVWASDRGDAMDALKPAVLGKNVKVVKKLYEKMKDKINLNSQTGDRQGETYLIVAAANDRKEVVEYLISVGADVNIVTTQDKWWEGVHPGYDQSALTFACKSASKEMVELLIKHGAVNHKTGKPSCDMK